jgi:hypothetical protein
VRHQSIAAIEGPPTLSVHRKHSIVATDLADPQSMALGEFLLDSHERLATRFVV